MQSEFQLPFLTDPLWVFGLFFIFLILFHIALVYIRPLSSVGWKRVDYIWISIALIGLLGALSESRQLFARGQQIWAGTRLIATFERARDSAITYSNSPSLCRQFIRTEYSPPKEEFDQIQKEHNEACEWFKKISEIFPKSLEAVTSEIDLGTFPAVPRVRDGILQVPLQQFQRSVENFNFVYRSKKLLDQQSRRSDLEVLFLIFSPLLLAIAIALRLTKVTGEIILEGKKAVRSRPKKRPTAKKRAS